MNQAVSKRFTALSSIKMLMGLSKKSPFLGHHSPKATILCDSLQPLGSTHLQRQLRIILTTDELVRLAAEPIWGVNVET